MKPRDYATNCSTICLVTRSARIGLLGDIDAASNTPTSNDGSSWPVRGCMSPPLSFGGDRFSSGCAEDPMRRRAPATFTCRAARPIWKPFSVRWIRPIGCPQRNDRHHNIVPFAARASVKSHLGANRLGQSHGGFDDAPIAVDFNILLQEPVAEVSRNSPFQKYYFSPPSGKDVRD